MISALANPARFMAVSRPLAPALGLLSLGLFGAGLWLSFTAPADYQQGDSVRIMFVHVPAAWIGLFAYAALGVASFTGLVWRHALADTAAKAAAPLGAGFTLLALITGSLWGRPMWGTWWVWDARLTSSLMLFMIFVAYTLLKKYGGPGSDKLGAGLALFGMANVPFIYVSVNYWRTLHPKTTVVPNLVPPMAGPMWWAFAGFVLMSLVLFALRGQQEEQRARVEALYLAADEG